MSNQEKSASDRKREHIELATRSQMSQWSNDGRFYYEPLLSAHSVKKDLSTDFLDREMKFPLWVSSMTGGTDQARQINERLAAACKEFGLGMGLGSCRILLEEPDQHLKDFALRKTIGPDAPFYANLGIAQLEKIIANNDWNKITRMMELLEADGLTIHVNPLQEWLQPEGDRFHVSPLETIKKVIDHLNCSIIVKEVGQGMGPKSLKALMELPVVIEFGAYGGTNFSKLEINRSDEEKEELHGDLSHVGHTAEEMVDFVNEILRQPTSEKAFGGLIISGGVKSYLDGYYLTQKVNAKAVYGQASALLKKAMISEKELFNYIGQQIEGFTLASNYLKIKS